MKKIKIYSLVLALSLTSITAIKADGKRIPISANSGSVYLPQSEISKIDGIDDGTLVCWNEDNFNGSLKVQKLDNNGKIVWASGGFTVDKNLGTGFTSDSDYPQLFSDNEGGAVVIYRKKFIDREDIFMQRVFWNGYETITPVCLSSFYGGYNYSPSAALAGENMIAVTWENFNQGEFDIHAQLISMNGRKLWNNGNELKICGAINDQRKPTIAVSENYLIMISWLDARGQFEYLFNLYSNMINIDGSILSDSKNGKLIFKNIVPQNPRKETFFPHNFVASEKNSFIIALEHSRDGQFSNINILKINEQLEREWILDLSSGSHQSNPLITKSDGYGATVIWNADEENEKNIYGIILDKNGNVTWGGKKGKKISFDGIKNPDARILPSEKIANGFCIYENRLITNWVTTGTNKLNSATFNLSDESGQYNVLQIQDEISEGEYTSVTAQRKNIVTVYKQSDNIFANVRNMSETGFIQAYDQPDLDNFPNPFNPSTKIYFSIPSDGFVRISVFDIAGRIINTLVNEYKSAGKHSITFDGSNLSSGVYFYRLEANGAAHTKRMTMLK